MKKNLILFGLVVSLNAFSQSSNFNKINSISQLKSEYKNVTEKDKRDYYLRYLELKEVDELKNMPEFKNFSDQILLQLADEMYLDEGSYENDFSDDKFVKTLAKVDQKSKEGGDLNYEDLLYLYDPDHDYSGMRILDLYVNKDVITFTRGNAIGGGNWDYTYKVKKNKLKLINTRNH